ncbi:ras guanine nucleotide exchange factor domain-containing protein [Mycena epipterygia]|nr:ras guanine nucleotide exchange factor domain-containing protein [Mycena epipterygia]
MSADIALELSLWKIPSVGVSKDLIALKIADLIQNVPRNTKQLGELNKRCISLLNGLKESSLDLEDRRVAGFLEEMEMVLDGIHRKLEKWNSLNPFSAFMQQATIQDWISAQNQRIEDAFRTMNTQFFVSHAIQTTENRAREERHWDEIRGYLTDILRSQLSSETSLHIRPVGTTLSLISQSADRNNWGTLNSPPIASDAGFSPDVVAPQTQRVVGLDISDSQTSLFQAKSAPPICNTVKRRISSGNVEGLLDHLIRTDDTHLEQVMLDTHRDFTTPEHFFDVIQERFKEVRREIGAYHIERHKIVKVVVAWLRTLEPESNISHRVREFALAVDNGLISNHQNMILKAIDDQTRGPMSSNYGDAKVEPMHPHQLAVALTLIEGDLRKSIRWIDYLHYEKGSPSRIDSLLSEHHKMIAWVQDSVLRHDDMQDRAHSIQRFTETAQACLVLQNYNSMAAIAQVLRKLDLPRTINILSTSTQKSLKRLTYSIAPDRDHKQFGKIEKGNAGLYIPWIGKFTSFVIISLLILPSDPQLDDLKRCLSKYPRTVGCELINFERYQQLAVKLPRYQAPSDLEAQRQAPHLAHLRDGLDNVVLHDDKAFNRRLRRVKEKEERDYQNRVPDLKRVGF